jgi:hypothetical protein
MVYVAPLVTSVPKCANVALSSHTVRVGSALRSVRQVVLVLKG